MPVQMHIERGAKLGQFRTTAKPCRIHNLVIFGGIHPITARGTVGGISTVLRVSAYRSIAINQIHGIRA